MKWYNALMNWKKKPYVKENLRVMVYECGKRVIGFIDSVFEKVTTFTSKDMINAWNKLKCV